VEKQNASLDSSFWINAFHVGIVHFLPEYFNLFVCQVAAEEIRYPLDVLGILAAGPSLFDQWCKSGMVTLQNPQAPVDWFHRGENAAIALAIENGLFLLIDDANPYHLAKSQGLKVIGTMDFTVFLYDQGRLSYPAAMSTTKAIRASEKLKRGAMIILEVLARTKGDKDAEQ
jgi:predicted nucleic acid-binding protein